MTLKCALAGLPNGGGKVVVMDHPDLKREAAFAELGKRGLTFDAWVYHPQIPEVTALARAFPDQPIVFDHFGGVLRLVRGSCDHKGNAIADTTNPVRNQDRMYRCR